MPKKYQQGQSAYFYRKRATSAACLLHNIFSAPILLFFLLFVKIQPALAQSSNSTDGKDSPGLNVFAFILEKFPLWISAIVVFGLSILAAIIIKGIVESRFAAKVGEEHQEILIISGRVTFMTVITIGATIALAIAGINITTLLAAVGFGISFGLQDTIANFVAGMALLASRPFTIGDWIKVGATTGKVVEIRTRATYLKTYDGLRMIVPNAQLYKSKVLSYTSNPMRRLKIPAYCRYGVNIHDVKEICLREVKKDRRIFLEPKASVIVTDLADSYIELQVRFWVDPKGPWRQIESTVFINIQNRLEEAGLDAPYAVTSLSMESDLESVVFKSKNLDANELSTLMSERMKEQEVYAKKREELLAKPVAVPVSVPVSPDQTGQNFLNNSGEVTPVN